MRKFFRKFRHPQFELVQALRHHDVERLRQALSRGADPNALMVFHQHGKEVRRLPLSFLFTHAEQMLSPWKKMALSDYRLMFEILLTAGASPNAIECPIRGTTPLSYLFSLSTLNTGVREHQLWLQPNIQGHDSRDIIDWLDLFPRIATFRWGKAPWPCLAEYLSSPNPTQNETDRDIYVTTQKNILPLLLKNHQDKLNWEVPMWVRHVTSDEVKEEWLLPTEPLVRATRLFAMASTNNWNEVLNMPWSLNVTQPCSGDSLIHWALVSLSLMGSEQTHVIERLLERGVSPKISNLKGHTPKDMLMDYDAHQVGALLERYELMDTLKVGLKGEHDGSMMAQKGHRL